jgi:predicted nucleic acid-binding protein
LRAANQAVDRAVASASPPGRPAANAGGRRRTLKTDALIAAVAIRARAEFVTVNRVDYEPFVVQELRLASMV